MLDSICCGVHENLYCAIICVILIGTGYVLASLFAFWNTLTWCDLAAFGIWFLLLVALGGRLLLLNTAFSKNLYDETQSYAELLLQEEPSLVSAFPAIREVVDPGQALSRIDLKTIPVKVVCSDPVTESQCREIAKFVRTRIRSMGGTPFADLQLSVWGPAPDSGETAQLFSETITVREQNEMQDFRLWVAKAFPVHPWLGTAALLMLAVLAGTAVSGLSREGGRPAGGIREQIVFSGCFCTAAVVIFGGFFLLNGFYPELLYSRMMMLFILPYGVVAAGCWCVRFFRRKRIPNFSTPITLFFTLFSVLAALFLLTVDSVGSSLW